MATVIQFRPRLDPSEMARVTRDAGMQGALGDASYEARATHERSHVSLSPPLRVGIAIARSQFTYILLSAVVSLYFIAELARVVFP